MGAMFISQQYLQNVVGHDTVEAGAAFLPAIVFMVLAAPRSAKLVESRGARTTLLSGYAFLMIGFLSMLLLWEEDSSYWQIGASAGRSQQADLDTIAKELNERPRQTLGFKSPSQALAEVLR
jgi:high-affinity nickel permease